LAQLAKGDGRVTALAQPHAMSLAAVSKHLIVLEKGGVGKAAAQRADAFAGAGGEANVGGRGVDRPVSEVLGGESGSIRKIFGQTTNEGNQTR
jgi:hypothetical protein